MSTKLVRAALALLCAVAVLFGTALFPGALGVEFESSGPLDSRASEPVTPDGTAPDDVDSGSTPVATSDGAETTPRTSDEPAATATPTPTETATATPVAGEGEDSGSPVLVKLIGLALIGGFGAVAVGVIRAASDPERDGSTDAGLLLHPLLDRLAGTVVSAVSNGAVGRTIGRIPKVTTAALLSGSSALSRVGAGISAVSGGVLTGLATGIGSVGTMSLRGVAGLPSTLGSLSVAPFRALRASVGPAASSPQSEVASIARRCLVRRTRSSGSRRPPNRRQRRTTARTSIACLSKRHGHYWPTASPCRTPRRRRPASTPAGLSTADFRQSPFDG